MGEGLFTITKLGVPKLFVFCFGKKTKQMIPFFKAIERIINNLNDRVGKAASWFTTILVILVCFDVVTRYLFSGTKAWIMELEWHLFALIFLLGAGYAFRHDRHVRVDLFYAKFSPREKAWVNLIGGILFLIPWCILIMYASYHYALGSYLIGEGSPDPGGLPARYLIKFAITGGVFLLFLQAISSLIHSALVITNNVEDVEDQGKLNEII